VNVPLYSPGQIVFHTSTNAPGQIISIVNLKEPGDIRLQGFRYLVKHSGILWSIPEKCLSTLPTTLLSFGHHITSR